MAKFESDRDQFDLCEIALHVVEWKKQSNQGVRNRAPCW